ncbi:MAG: aminopeptidase P family N-terminal domain-containing protein, partial [Dongiaceae bacterium]
MTKSRANPLGDGELEELLRRAGSRYDEVGLQALLAGVAAAPPSADPDAWMALVLADPDEELKVQLRTLRRQVEAAAKPADDGNSPGRRAERVAALRDELTRQGLAGFIVPRADEHQGEYVPPRAERLSWLTGFTGSAGMAIVLGEQAAIFVDGRYTLQVAAQVGGLFAVRHLIDQPPENWIAEHLPKGGRLGYDPWLHTPDGLEPLRRGAGRAGGELTACGRNAIDAAWPNQPPPPVSPVVAHDVRHAGRGATEKRAELGAKILDGGADAAVLTAPDSIAWLLNIRGADVPRTPLPLGFAVLHGSGLVDLFIDRRKLAPGLESHLGNGVALSDPDELGPALDRLGQEKRRVLADPSSAASWIFDRLATAGAQTVRGSDPCALPKACKNPVEIAGARAAHIRDGAAVSRFLAWLSQTAPSGQLTEIDAADRLAALRRENELFRDFSFDTISGAGPNGAIVHYRVTPETNRRLEPGQIYLIDSGAQYLDGTTDITRTVAIGAPPSAARARFTRVLKGHIALGSARFP